MTNEKNNKSIREQIASLKWKWGSNTMRQVEGQWDKEIHLCFPWIR